MFKVGYLHGYDIKYRYFLQVFWISNCKYLQMFEGFQTNILNKFIEDGCFSFATGTHIFGDTLFGTHIFEYAHIKYLSP